MMCARSYDSQNAEDKRKSKHDVKTCSDMELDGAHLRIAQCVDPQDDEDASNPQPRHNVIEHAKGALSTIGRAVATYPDGRDGGGCVTTCVRRISWRA